jgi:hypothetical protein
LLEPPSRPRRRHELRNIGRQRNRAWFLITGTVHNIIRIAALDEAVT